MLERIKQTGDIFMAWSDRQWILDGAAVHVSIIGFDGGIEQCRTLDGQRVSVIHSDLTADVATADASPLARNAGIAFMGVTPSGKFDLDYPAARTWLTRPNASGRSNSDVLRPWMNALDIVRRASAKWIIDFGVDVNQGEAAGYEAPFEHVARVVAPARAGYRTGKRGYWCFERPRPDMRHALERNRRFIATPLVSKHRAFVWLGCHVLCANLVIVFARDDDYFFGVLHSSIHELWALRMGTQLEDRPRYTPTTCFETFPLPWAPGHEPTDHPVHQRISAAARELNELRERWLNPPEWIGPLAAAIDAGDKFADVPPEARPLIRESAIMAAAAQDPQLKKRTLTNLYNERPTWLRLAHERLDRAVLAAYAAVDPAGEWAEDWAQVWTDTGAGQPLPDDHPLAARRRDPDQRVLANLLRLNLDRGPEP